ncbi:hypothetical protein D3874_17565 [Oleomonas cavernae]|uniref:Uncharacterized protein n=1 Tax=Oleomonas cavernae TaxID=2320859 RepID=A0A418WEX6_9PROT|nr:hypothetical protein D3874_17565 [Oleomonas cavernae]
MQIDDELERLRVAGADRLAAQHIMQGRPLGGLALLGRGVAGSSTYHSAGAAPAAGGAGASAGRTCAVGASAAGAGVVSCARAGTAVAIARANRYGARIMVSPSHGFDPQAARLRPRGQGRRRQPSTGMPHRS